MRHGIHPDDHPVVFRDRTGTARIVDSEGRNERFRRRFGNGGGTGGARLDGGPR